MSEPRTNVSTSTPTEPGGRRSTTKRRDDDPIHITAGHRVVYWPTGVVGEGKRKFKRCADQVTAEAFVADLRAQLDRHRIHGPLSSAPLFKVMGAMIAQLESAGKPYGSIKKYRSNWNEWIPEHIRRTACHELNIGHWTQVFDNLNSKQAGPTVVKSVDNTLNKLITWGSHRQYFTADNAFGTRAARSAVYKEAITTATRIDLQRRAAHAGTSQDEFTEALIELAHCPDWNDVEKYATAFEATYPGYGYRLVLVAYATGMRECELLALRTEHIIRKPDQTKIRVMAQLDRYHAWPAFTLPKNGKIRSTIIWDAFADVLDSLIDDALARTDDTHGYLFPPLTRKSWPDCFTHMATEVKNAVGWRWGFHWLRHAFASLSLAPTSAGGYGLEVSAVSEWLGHANPSTTLNMYLVKPKDAIKQAKRLTLQHPRDLSNRLDS